MIQLEEYQLSEILTKAAHLGATNFAVKQGLVKSKISKTEAYKMYSRRLVDGWIKKGKVKPVKVGNRLLVDTIELETVSNTNDIFNKHIKQPG